MRLATCVAAELAVGAIVVGSLAGGAVWAVTELRPEAASSDPGGEEETGAPADVAAPVPGEPAPVPATATVTPAPPADTTGEALVGRAPAPAATERTSIFAGHPDQALLAPIREGGIARVKIGSCCTSLNMRIDFDNGARAAFKPEQRNLGSMPRKEIAAYRMDRLLGIGRVPPSIARRFRVDEIAAHLVGAGPAERLRLQTEMVAQEGETVGELTWWIPDLAKPSIEGLFLDSPEGVAIWQRELTLGAEIAAEHAQMVAQISSVVLFDFIINNIDRWSGSNILGSKDGSSLYFMDNTMAFRPQPRGHQKARFYLRRAQKFSRSLVAALRELRVEDVRDAVSRDLGAMEYLLNESEMAAVLSRRDDALAYIDQLIATHGEAAVLVFP